MTHKNNMDLSILYEYANNDLAAVKELLEAFHETFDEGLAELKTAIDTSAEDWKQAAHKLKGASVYVGAEYLKELCGLAQQDLNASTDKKKAYYLEIKQIYDAISAEIKKAL